ncbi:MAG: phosphonate ABC transporter ATP-binding protein [Pirellulales bacterium]|nr:phosphonate ABC transporter ATP-binding protein [Pirellulales bacterium]
MQLILAVDKVEVCFPGGIRALDAVSLKVPLGQVTTLLGSSGAGKSTMLRCLNGLQKPTSGRVLINDGRELGRGAALRQHRRRTGMVFQLHHLIGRHSALKNVLMGRLGYHSWWRTLAPLSSGEVELAMDCLERVGLADRALQRADQLSGGERQRVGIARALAQKPHLILADEPVASLDPATARSIMDLIYRVCREDGLSAVFSLHQLDLAKKYSDRIIGLCQGRKVFDGAPQEMNPERLSAIYGDELGAELEEGQPLAATNLN